MGKNFDRMSSHFDRQDKKLGERTEKMRQTHRYLAGLEHKARQPRLATEVDVESDTKTRKHTEGAAAADRVNNRDSSSARDDDGPTNLISFGMIAEPLAPEKCIGDALVNNGAEAPKPHLPSIEVRMLSSAAGDLLPAGTASAAMRTIFPLPLLSWVICEAKET